MRPPPPLTDPPASRVVALLGLVAAMLVAVVPFVLSLSLAASPRSAPFGLLLGALTLPPLGVAILRWHRLVAGPR
jgi:hypothetical protein